MSVLYEISGPPLSGALSERWIFERIEEWVAREPGRIAFAVDRVDHVEQYCFADVQETFSGLAAALHAGGIARGDRVGILMENTPQWVFVLLAAMRVGAATVPLATLWPENALRAVAEHAGCRLIFADRLNLDKASSVAAGIGARVVEFGVSDSSVPPWAEFLAAAGPLPPWPEGLGDETVILIYTSGTTGDPKGVQLTLNNLIYEIPGVVEPLGLSKDDRILSVLPFSHVLPLLANGVGPLCVGAAVVFLASVSPQRIAEAFRRHRITCFICVPQFFYQLHKKIFTQIQEQGAVARHAFRLIFALAKRISDQKFRRRLFHRIHENAGPDLRLFISGGSRFDPRIGEDLTALGYSVLEAYGLTETTAAATATTAGRNSLGTVGRPIRGVSVRIDSPNTDGVGEVWIRGPIVMKGYYRDPEKTREVMAGEWFRSGDLGYIRADGNLVITGRSKDVIVLANGKNVYPEELEAHYAQSPFVKEICVLGLSEDEGGPAEERLHAVVVPNLDEFRRRGQTAIADSLRFALENLSKQLPSYQRPMSLSVRNDPFPRTTTRKLKRFEIEVEEIRRRRSGGRSAATEDHPRFRHGPGAVVAALVRESKPHAGALDLTTNLELDLGFDSLGRVELFGLAESRIGIRIDEQTASGIFTLGELLDVLSASEDSSIMRGRNWKEILNASASGETSSQLLVDHWWITKLTFTVLNRFMRLLCGLLFRLEGQGLEKLPRTRPYMICPNHESFLDGVLVVALLPRRVTDHIFILGYTEHWGNVLTRQIARFCNIVSIDPSVNLTRAMQAGAAGLGRNRVLLVFPEGTRSIDGRIAEFKKGAAILACELGVPVVPVGIRGAFEAWPRGGTLRFRPIRIIFGDPIDPALFGRTPDPYAALTEALRNSVRNLTGQTG